jgi:hypothetical protein
VIQGSSGTILGRVVSHTPNRGMIRGMIEWARRHWREFKESKPGHRFQERYYRNRRRSGGRFSVRRIANIVVGSVIAIVSLFFGWAPGPGTLTFFIGMGLVAGELLPVARFLDWAEVRLRKLARFVAKVWRESLLGKAAVVVVAALIAAAIAYTVYRVFFGG